MCSTPTVFPTPSPGKNSSFYKSTVVEEVTSDGRIQIVHPTSSSKFDFVLANDPSWSQRLLERRVRRDVLDAGPRCVAAAGDITLGELLYYREGGSEKPSRNITGVLLRSGDSLEREHLERTAAEIGV